MNAIQDETAFLYATPFCQSGSPIIRQAALNITKKCHSQQEKVTTLFYWVRDSIRYELGITPDSAVHTLMKAGGSCTHKANLLVALLRSLGIPAGFHVMEVNGKDYLGVLSTDIFKGFMNSKSLHVYCAVKIKGEWLRLDPADDIRLSNGIQHLVVQATEVHFDGTGDAMLLLDPDHILSDTTHPCPSVDHIMSKQRRIPSSIIEVFNHYLDFMRNRGIWYTSVKAFETDFFSWLEQDKGYLHSEFFSVVNTFTKSLPVETAHLAQRT